MASNKMLHAPGFLLLLLLVKTAAANPAITAMPIEIDLALSEVFDVNCSFSFGGSSNRAHLISLMLSRANGSQEDFTDLASIGQYSTNVNLLTSEHITARGFFGTLNDSFIHLHWEQPTEQQTGFYKCLAYTTDAYGRLIAMNDIAEVSGNQPTLDDWKTKVMEMSTNMRIFQKEMAMLEEQRKFSETFMDYMTYKNSTYYVYKKYMFNIYEATEICERFGGYLVEINDVGEYEALRSYLKSIPLFPQGFLVAGTDERHERRWIFPRTNQSFPSLSWNKDDPNGGRRQNCLVLWRPGGLRLGDISCYPNGYTVSFVCEIPRNE